LLKIFLLSCGLLFTLAPALSHVFFYFPRPLRERIKVRGVSSFTLTPALSHVFFFFPRPLRERIKVRGVSSFTLTPALSHQGRGNRKNGSTIKGEGFKSKNCGRVPSLFSSPPAGEIPFLFFLAPCGRGLR